ncbi:FixH family protein [Chitinophaga pinensis]|uniref:FixH family protein n=1 Tax=Chitinophaga pinensis (strain ATCC 43595 / DSM 2588 / LMG 13176 / NBRC 15968 / NCIMB 11800 / UQM 2034) TaxID=485918 RepID=A0A979G057_CHIPD|nr:FixH family protein [Chitinophaga pinensis]ACU58183.1 FixH family protein [Chitinophaga pinensis DSM 2588]
MNWGHKIIIVFILFAAGILTLVTKSMHTRIDMVTPDYYAEELKYQQVIDGRREAQSLSAPVSINQSVQSIGVLFPAEMHGVALKGTVLFYRASDSRQDVSVPLKTDENGLMLVSKRSFRKGNYRVQLQWEAGGKNYFQENLVTIN